MLFHGYIITMKKHATIPNEPEEAPVTPENPEINQPTDPKEREIPEEAPQQDPEELPAQKDEPEMPGEVQ